MNSLEESPQRRRRLAIAGVSLTAILLAPYLQ
jgi:hypothetical protein